MNRHRQVTWLTFMILILSFLVIPFQVEITKAEGDTIWVDDNFTYPEESDGSIAKPFTTLQAAINAANDGDTIKVLPGTYSEDLTINRSVTITTKNPVSTFITSKTRGAYLVDITSSNVSFEGFTLEDNSTTSHRKAVIHISPEAEEVRIINNNINKSYDGFGLHVEGNFNAQKAVINNNTFYNTNGIKIENSFWNNLFGNIISNTTDYPAIILYYADGTYIEQNLLENNTYGIYTQKESDIVSIINNTIWDTTYNGITLVGGSNNLIQNNSISNNPNNGISISSQDSQIINNDIYDNGIGIVLDGRRCDIKDNRIRNCKTYGLYARSISSKNQVSNNTFTHPPEYHALEEGSNYWNDTELIGNYWDDYYGPDNDNDSRGDIPYTIGGVNDLYPKGIFQQPPIISDPSPDHLESGVALQPKLSVKVVDPENKRINVNFYVIIENETRLINEVPIGVESGARAAVPFFSTVQGKNAVYTYLGTGYDYFCIWYAVAYDEYSSFSSVDISGTEWIFTTLHTPIDNEKPIADAGGPYNEIQLGDTVQFDGLGCNDTDGTIEFYRWTFGDGESVVNVRSPNHKYESAGVYEVSLVVIDNNGGSNVDITQVEVIGDINDPPVAVYNNIVSALVGDTLQFNASGSWDPDEGDTISYFWDFGDNIGISTEIDPTYQYSSAGSYTVTLTVTDDSGDSDTKTFDITVKTKSEEGIPGFEILILIIAILLVTIFFKKIKK